jgi:hypothetical protein
MATNKASSNKGTHSSPSAIKLANKSSVRFMFFEDHSHWAWVGLWWEKRCVGGTSHPRYRWLQTRCVPLVCVKRSD